MTPRYQYGRRCPPVVLTVPFEIPAPQADETAPKGPPIRRPVKRKGVTVAHVVDIIRRETLEARV